MEDFVTVLTANPLTVAVFLAVAVNRFVEAVISPVFAKFNLDRWYIMPISWVLAGVLVWLAGVNLFVGYLPDELIGRIVSAIVAGGGANLLHDVFDQK